MFYKLMLVNRHSERAFSRELCRIRKDLFLILEESPGAAQGDFSTKNAQHRGFVGL